jgi:hypothetical protein
MSDSPPFAPVRDLTDLDSLNLDEIVAGYRDYRRGDPEPGPNRGRAYWHGWRNARSDHDGPTYEAQRQLAHAVVKSWRKS